MPALDMPAGAYYDDPLHSGAEASERFDPFKILLYIVQYRWLIGILVVSCLGVGLVTTFLQTPKFRATSSIEVMPATAKVLSDLNVVDQAGDLRAFETAKERLMSRDVAARVVSSLGLAENANLLFPRPDFSVSNIIDRAFGVSAQPDIAGLSAKNRESRAIGRVLAGLSVELVRNTSILNVSYAGPDPQLAAAIANQVVKSYMDQQIDQTMSTSDLARQFIQQQVEETKSKLAASEKALVAYAKSMGMTVSEKDGSLISSNIEAINTALSQAIEDRLAKERLVQQIDAGNRATLPKVIENEVIQSSRTDIAKLKAEYQQKLQTFKPSYPEMQTLSAQINELERQVEVQISQLVGSIRVEYEDAVNREADLRRKLFELQQEQADFRDKGIQYTILNREVESNRAQYTVLIDKMNTLGVSDIKQSNINVVDTAIAPDTPYSPRMLINLALALGGSLILSAAVIYVIELLNNKFNVPDQIEAELRLPVLGILPKVEGEQLEAAIRDPKSPLAEAFRSLRTSLQFAGPNGAPGTLAVTSAEPGESKSTTAFKLAEEFGAIGLKVLLVDADLRRPSLHHHFRTDNALGLSNLLTSTVGADEIRNVFRATEFPHVTFVSSGPLAPNPADLLSSSAMASVLAACRKKFDLIILDCPPVIGLSDAPVLSRMAEATLMVVSAHRVTRKAARAALKRLRATGGNVVGAALAMFAIDRVEYSYAYRYMNDGYYAYASGTESIEDKRGVSDRGTIRGRAARASRTVARLFDRSVGSLLKRD